jgi:hypothetical protein
MNTSSRFYSKRTRGLRGRRGYRGGYHRYLWQHSRGAFGYHRHVGHIALPPAQPFHLIGPSEHGVTRSRDACVEEFALEQSTSWPFAGKLPYIVRPDSPQTPLKPAVEALFFRPDSSWLSKPISRL